MSHHGSVTHLVVGIYNTGSPDAASKSELSLEDRTSRLPRYNLVAELGELVSPMFKTSFRNEESTGVCP
jgi:hypothetical protein